MNRLYARIGIALVFISAIIVIGAVYYVNQSQVAPPDLMMTMEPDIIANLTALPMATTLSGESGELLAGLERMVTDCSDYSPERRAQMQSHMTWLHNPDQIPTDIAIALGSNPPGKLVFGMATYTSIEWRLADKPIGSCLLQIGQHLNTMLVALDEPPFSLFNKES